MTIPYILYMFSTQSASTNYNNVKRPLEGHPGRNAGPGRRSRGLCITLLWAYSAHRTKSVVPVPMMTQMTDRGMPALPYIAYLKSF